MVSIPEDNRELHEFDQEHCSNGRNYKINHTTSLRFLDKAAVINDGSDGPWILCSVTQVEETKQIFKLLPIFMVTIMPSVMASQVLTIFIQQGKTLDCSMGPHFNIPPASLSSFFTIGMLTSVIIYEKCFMPFVRKYSTINPRGITLLQRIGIGQALHVIIMVMAALTERWRLSIVRDHGLVHQKTTVPLTIFAILPQFALMGVAEMFVEVSKMEFFYDQAPQGMKSLGASFFYTSSGIGNFLSTFILSTAAKVTRNGNNSGWIENNLNESHLDYYYEFLAVLNAINFIFFLLVSIFYVYNEDVIESHNQAKEVNSI